VNVAHPTGYDVAVFLGREDDQPFVFLADEHVTLVTAFVKAYTRGRGFVDQLVADDLLAVIITATARLVLNPTHTVSESVGSYAHRPGTLEGWTLPELAVLHRYRRRTA